MDNKKIFFLVIGILILGTIGMALLQSSSGGVPTGPGKYDTFATCLKDKGAVFYGAFWCPHCQAQKKAFGSSAHLLPYVECSTPDANGQLQVCKDQNITGYPTWILKDGTRIPDDSLDGAGVKLETLAAKTGCVLPQ
jgi:thiol-disulfide isomerase/thioredoxin